MNKEDGIVALKIARSVIELWVRERKKFMFADSECPVCFRESTGVFVTLFTYPDKQLRGCIGYPEPEQPLIEALIDSAVSATQDPRFPPVAKEELARIIIHVSVLTKPEQVRVSRPEEYQKKIEIGKDGLVIELGYNRGLLLPEVAEEHSMDAVEFLNQACVKAGLPPAAWRSEQELRVYKFQTQKFAEKEPGKV